MDFAYSGGGTSVINNTITGVGGFTYYSRGIGGGNGMTIQLNNNNAVGGGGNDDYQGTTSFLVNPAQGGQGDTNNNWGVIQWTQNNQFHQFRGRHECCLARRCLHGRAE